MSGKEVSKRRCRLNSAPSHPSLNIEPQRMIGAQNGAPKTFSITHGTPVVFKRSQVGATRFGCCLEFHIFRSDVYA